MQKAEPTSHKQILKSTGIMGGEQAIVVLSGIVRSKIIALLLGPMGIGISGLYQSTIDFVKAGTGMGLGFSAVREVAAASVGEDERKISDTIYILRRWVWCTGLAGMLLILLFCRQMSQYVFGDVKHEWQFALLSVSVLLGALSSGQMALLQGLRKIASMAKANVGGVLVGLLISIPLLWLCKLEGIVLSMVVVSAAGLGFSWYFAAKIRTIPVRLTAKETFAGGLDMAKLGFFMVFATLLSTGTMYVVRMIVAGKTGLAGVGQFQAAWSISAMYLTTILNAMSADYFPRLSAVGGDDVKTNNLVNEQTEIALLLAGPVIILVLSFIWVLLSVLYSAKFNYSISILQWQIFGTFFKVISWPIGFVFLARKMNSYFIIGEILWNLLYIGIVLIGWKPFGIEITGISFLVSYVVITLFYLTGTRMTSGFTWSARNIQLMLFYGLLILLAFLTSKELTGYIRSICGVALSGGGITMSYYHLRRIISVKAIVQKFFRTGKNQ
jgi:antigen flippase